MTQATQEQIIDEQRIRQILAATRKPGNERVGEILARARQLEGLTLDESAELLALDDPEALGRLFAAAKLIKDAIYGDRLVLFAPLYVSNYCSNDCLYCGFRRSNKSVRRKKLTVEEIGVEVKALEDLGHKRLLLVFGEGPLDGADSMVEAIEAVYATKSGNGEIRRVNVNCAPLSVDDFRKLKGAGIGTFQIFQETYHRETYKVMHPSGKKADYDWRVTAPSRAMEAGIDDVGIGALFGLYDYRFEVLATIAHSDYLERHYGVGPHTISMPRLEPAEGSEIAANPPHAVSDADFRKLVAVIRLAVPYTGMILSTRERAELRNELVEIGISQISAGSKVTPGGYQTDVDYTAQFEVVDTRTPDQIINDMCKIGHIPSYCTACYRSGRTGSDFMHLAKPGFIQDFCAPNAIVTFKEYLLDYATPETRKLGEDVLRKHVEAVASPKIKEELAKMFQRMENGERDLYF